MTCLSNACIACVSTSKENECQCAGDGELDFSDFEKAGGGGVKKGMVTETTGEKRPRESNDIARPSK